ncbi:hypothetical protein CISG_10220 [Coccidioides immitis RMSCC 3703]|uniref:Uncharacterized protein n=1 Tax=Coccidioides immitis RMSCC 3703 TaxID=454286 RepID=A0A0J8QRF1_COCIT|nr:hypothetical protein CISG_10220 [Coccidioides immitis RMSCC 3703]
MVRIEYLERVEKEWMGFAEQLDKVPQSNECWCGLMDSLYGIQHCLEYNILQQPAHWQPLLGMPVSAIAMCIGLIQLLKLQDEHCQQERAQLWGHITWLKAQISQNTLAERLSLYQLLLHICLILLSYNDPALCKLQGKEVNVASWSQDDWEERCNQFDRLSDDNYEALANFLGEFTPFAGIKLTGEGLKNQSRALMGYYQAIAGEITSETGAVPQKSDKYSFSANLMISCATLGVFAMQPIFKHRSSRETHLKDHTTVLSQSPLYVRKTVTVKTSAILAAPESRSNRNFDTMKNLIAIHSTFQKRNPTSAGDYVVVEWET